MVFILSNRYLQVKIELYNFNKNENVYGFFFLLLSYYKLLLYHMY